MQVPVAWAATFGREPHELFDPCINVSIGSAMLSAYDYACAHATTRVRAGKPVGPRARRTCILHRYAEAVGMPDLETVVRLDIRSQRVLPASPGDAPILAVPLLRPWGAASLLVPMAPAPELLRTTTTLNASSAKAQPPP
jgi:hypothetical protein